MARSVPPDRLPALIEAAVGVFVTHGYRRTQVQDIADVLGLAKGTLYGYAATKEALFAAAIRYGDRPRRWNDRQHRILVYRRGR